MTEYTIGLALEDFIPVIFSSIGLFFVSRLVGRVDGRLQQMATAGWLLVTTGGFLKASWKLTMALTGGQTDIVWMDKGMFMWMAVGFTLLATALWYFDENADPAKRIWLIPSIILGLTFAATLFTGFPNFEINTWRFILLGVMTLANVFMVVLLIQLARKKKLNTAALLFLGSIVIVFILSGLARIPDQTIPLQWTEQLLNTAAQGAFAYAVWTVYKTSEEPATEGQVAIA